MMPTNRCKISRDFLRACQRGDLITLKNIKTQHETEDWTIYRHDVSGDTGLHVAAREGHLDVVKYLCEAWQKPAYRADVTNKDMKRPLHEAAQFARIDVVQYLIQRDVLIDALRRADWTPLMLACTKSGTDARRCIQSLLDAGADPCMRNSDGWNSLFIACRTGDGDAVKLLLHQAPQCIHTRSNNGRSALHIAAFHGSADTIDLLVTTDPNILSARDSSGSTALHESAKSGILRVTERLRELGANVEAVDDVGQNVLHVAAACGSLDVMEYILANALVDVHSEAQFGLTPLMAARRHKKDLAVDMLTTFGANK